MDTIKTDLGVIWFDVANNDYVHTTDDANEETRLYHARLQLNKTITPEFICGIADLIRKDDRKKESKTK